MCVCNAYCIHRLCVWSLSEFNDHTEGNYANLRSRFIGYQYIYTIKLYKYYFVEKSYFLLLVVHLRRRRRRQRSTHTIANSTHTYGECKTKTAWTVFESRLDRHCVYTFAQRSFTSRHTHTHTATHTDRKNDLLIKYESNSTMNKRLTFWMNDTNGR